MRLWSNDKRSSIIIAEFRLYVCTIQESFVGMLREYCGITSLYLHLPLLSSRDYPFLSAEHGDCSAQYSCTGSSKQCSQRIWILTFCKLFAINLRAAVQNWAKVYLRGWSDPVSSVSSTAFYCLLFAKQAIFWYILTWFICWTSLYMTTL